jgi:DNA repair photolyase
MGKLFQVSVEKKYLKELDEKLVDEKYNKFLAYFGNKEDIFQKLLLAKNNYRIR